MMRRGRAMSATILMLGTYCHSVSAFAITIRTPAAQRLRNWTTLLPLAKGFGTTPEPPESSESEAPRQQKAKSLMPLADAASKLLPKESKGGELKFQNPGVGDFQVFDALVKYPSTFELKIIGVDEDGFVGDIRKVVAACLTKGDDHVVACTTREKGKYTSITIKVYVESSSQLYKCYEVINEDSRVKFKF